VNGDLFARNASRAAFLVTGSSGFLGRALTARLHHLGARVVAWSRAECDLEDSEAVRKRLQNVEVDAVIHLAGRPDRTRALSCTPELMRAHFTTTLNLMQATEASLLHVGTLDEYGAGRAPFQEEQASAPNSPYALSKLAAGHLVCMGGGVHVRLSLVYGPGQSSGFLVPQLLNALEGGGPLAMSPGEQQRDFLYLEDAVDGLIRIALCPSLRGGIVNLCTGTGTPLRDLVGLLEQAAGRPVPVRLGTLPYRSSEVFQSVGCPERLRKHTHWRPGISLAEGLGRLLAARGAPGPLSSGHPGAEVNTSERRLF